MKTTTSKELKAGFDVVVAVTETIREAHEIPGGTLYAALMTKGMDFQTYEKLVSIITGSGLVEKRGDLLRWVGPELGVR